MFSKITSSVMIDLLFNLLLTFVCLFFLSFLLVNDPSEDDTAQISSDAQYLITMNWDEDADVDLWVKIPDGTNVYYGRRESGPVHLDLDVVGWRIFSGIGGKTTYIYQNQEILSIRGVMEGEYVVNAHYFGGHVQDAIIPVQIIVQDVMSKRIVWAGEMELNQVGHEAHAVILEIEATSGSHPSSIRVVDGPPRYIVGR